MITKKTLISLIAFICAMGVSFTAAAQDEFDSEEGAASIDTADADSGEGVVDQGRFHVHGGLGLDLPGMNFGDDDVGLPIILGAQYFVIDNLPVGARFKFDYVFVEDPLEFYFINFHVMGGYNILDELQAFMLLGLSHLIMEAQINMGPMMGGNQTVSADETYFSMGFGASYTYYILDALGIEGGFEVHFIIGDDIGGNSDNAIIYEMLTVGARYSI